MQIVHGYSVDVYDLIITWGWLVLGPNEGTADPYGGQWRLWHGSADTEAGALAEARAAIAEDRLRRSGEDADASQWSE